MTEFQGHASDPPWSPRYRAALGWIVLAVVMWNAIEAAGAGLMATHGPLDTVVLRYASHIVLLVLACAVLKGDRPFHTSRPLLQLARGFMMFLMPAAFTVAIAQTSREWIWSIFWLAPAAAIVGAALVLGERPSRRAEVAAVLGPVGVLFILRPDVGGWIATGGAVVMGGSLVGYILLTRVLKHERITASLLFTAIGAGLPTLIAAGGTTAPASTAEWLTTIVLGGVSLILITALDRAFEDVAVSRVAPILVGVVGLETLTGVAPRLDATGWLGVALLMGAVFLSPVGEWWAANRRRPSAD